MIREYTSITFSLICSKLHSSYNCSTLPSYGTCMYCLLICPNVTNLD